MDRADRQFSPDALTAVRTMLSYIGEDITREGLVDTPERVVKSWGELFGGYRVKVEDLFIKFEDGKCDEMVVLKDVEFTSTCEHHLMPFIGTASIGYVPDKHILGLSKMARLLDAYARRLQVQERLTQEVTTALDAHLKPLGSACVIKARHSCMVCRGVLKQRATMITSSLTGVFRQKPEVRAEFLALARG